MSRDTIRLFKKIRSYTVLLLNSIVGCEKSSALPALLYHCTRLLEYPRMQSLWDIASRRPRKTVQYSFGTSKSKSFIGFRGSRPGSSSLLTDSDLNHVVFTFALLSKPATLSLVQQYGSFNRKCFMTITLGTLAPRCDICVTLLVSPG